MAAPIRKMVGVSDDSSSSDDEVLRRCQEAVWETKVDKKKDGDNIVPQSKRVVVAEHEHDGNELQVTKGFQSHVAKKLGNYLDNCITEMQAENSTSVNSAKSEDDDDEGFRLFSSSVPGQKAEDPPAPVRRRPVPSSSDSDSEMETRLKEAAVSIKDLLPSLSLPSTGQAPSAETPCSEKVKKKKKKKATEEEEEENHVVKKKKKRKPNQEDSDSAASLLNAQNNGDQEHTEVQVKRKKKKKKELNMTD